VGVAIRTPSGPKIAPPITIISVIITGGTFILSPTTRGKIRLLMSPSTIRKNNYKSNEKVKPFELKKELRPLKRQSIGPT